MKEVITRAETTTGEDPTARIRLLTGPIATKVVPNDPVNTENAKTMPRTSAKHVVNVERSDISVMSAKATLPTN